MMKKSLPVLEAKRRGLEPGPAWQCPGRTWRAEVSAGVWTPWAASLRQHAGSRLTGV